MKSYLLLITGIFCLQSVLHAEMREWTSAEDPTRKIRGEFRGAQGNMVALRLSNGKMVKFEITKLSAADQEFIRNGGKSPKSEPITITNPESGDPGSAPAEVMSAFVYGEDADKVYLRLKENKGLKGGVNEILRGRTGLNDMYFIEPKGVRYGLFFDFGEKADGLLEVSLQSDGFSADHYGKELMESWLGILEGLVAEFGEPKLMGAFPEKDTVKEGLSMSTAIWVTEKGQLYLGIGQTEGKYSCVVRIRESGFLAQ